jgi:hypothetical protein
MRPFRLGGSVPTLPPVALCQGQGIDPEFEHEARIHHGL